MSLLLVTYRGPTVDIAVPERFPVASTKRKEAARKLDKLVAERRKAGKLTARDEAQLRKSEADRTAPGVIERSPVWKGGGMALRRGTWCITKDELRYLQESNPDYARFVHVHKELPPEPADGDEVKAPKTRKARTTAAQRAEARQSAAAASKPAGAGEAPKSSRRRSKPSGGS